MGQLTNMLMNQILQSSAEQRADQRRQQRAQQIANLYSQFLNVDQGGPKLPGFNQPPTASEYNTAMSNYEQQSKAFDANSSIIKKSLFAQLQGLGENVPVSMLQQDEHLDLAKAVQANPEIQPYVPYLQTLNYKDAQVAVRQMLMDSFKNKADEAALNKEFDAMEKASGIPREQLRGFYAMHKYLGGDPMKMMSDKHNELLGQQLANYIQGVNWDSLSPGDKAYITKTFNVSADELQKIFGAETPAKFTPQTFLSFSNALMGEMAGNWDYTKFTQKSPDLAPEKKQWFAERFTETGQPKAEYIVNRWEEAEAAINATNLDHGAKLIVQGLIAGNHMITPAIRQQIQNNIGLYGSSATVEQIINAYLRSKGSSGPQN